MKPDAPAPAFQPARERLLARSEELRALLQAAAEAAVHSGDKPAEVLDFKDVAAGDIQAVLDETALAHATEELAQIGAALQRIDAGSYGQCQDCGEAIDARRLQALPATAFCTACQARHEHERPGARR